MADVMRKVRFGDPDRLYRMFKNELDQSYFDVMASGNLMDRGQLRRFEENLARFARTRFAVGLNSGYDALHLSFAGGGDRIGRRSDRAGAYLRRH